MSLSKPNETDAARSHDPVRMVAIKNILDTDGHQDCSAGSVTDAAIQIPTTAAATIIALRTRRARSRTHGTRRLIRLATRASSASAAAATTIAVPIATALPIQEFQVKSEGITPHYAAGGQHAKDAGQRAVSPRAATVEG